MVLVCKANNHQLLTWIIGRYPSVFLDSRLIGITSLPENCWLLPATKMEPSERSFNGILGRFTPDYSTLSPEAASRRARGNRNDYRTGDSFDVQIPGIGNARRTAPVDVLPPFIPILNTLLRNTGNGNGKGSLENFITNVGMLHDVAFSPKCPILGTGHHFAVFAIPFDAEDRGFEPSDGRAINGEVYCLKTPNFTSNAATDSPAAKNAFRMEFYNTVLQELRVLLHPRLRRCENIISLLGLDFQEDYDDYTVAWPVLLMEYAEYGTLATLQEDISIDTELVRILLLDMALGIKALHDCNIIHGDVKSENVLICRHARRRYIARLADFGLSVINPESNNNRHRLPGGTFLWSAPEFCNELSVYGLKQTDVYSFGLTSWRVLSNRPNPFLLIPLLALGIHTTVAGNEAVTAAKSHPHFDELVLRTMGNCGATYSRGVIKSTLNNYPTSRDLDLAISALSLNEKMISPWLVQSTYCSSVCGKLLIGLAAITMNLLLAKPTGPWKSHR
jgi:Protein kinase domain